MAELGAAFVCADLALTPEVRVTPRMSPRGSRCLRMTSAVFAAASHAQKAADYLSGLQKPQDAAAA